MSMHNASPSSQEEGGQAGSAARPFNNRKQFTSDTPCVGQRWANKSDCKGQYWLPACQGPQHAKQCLCNCTRKNKRISLLIKRLVRSGHTRLCQRAKPTRTRCVQQAYATAALQHLTTTIHQHHIHKQFRINHSSAAQRAEPRGARYMCQLSCARVQEHTSQPGPLRIVVR